MLRELLQRSFTTMSTRFGDQAAGRVAAPTDQLASSDELGDQPKNAKSIENGTGIAWPAWEKLLAPHRDLNHTEMAKVTLAEIRKVGRAGNPEWWAQSVTVAYEQQIGRRVVGQSCEGDYSVTVSKTLTGELDATAERWSSFMAGSDELRGVAIVDGPRTSATEKWRYWRCGLDGGSRSTSP